MNRSSLIPPAELRRLSQRLVDLQGRIDVVEKSMRATQLSHSSIEGGSLVIRDVAGLPRGYVGMQPDGTSGLRAVNGPPPPRPNTPDVVPLMAGVGVTWNGEFATGTRPLDFSHLNVYASGAGESFIHGPSNLVGTLTNAGSVPVAPVTGTYWARFVAVNTSDEESEPSFTASGTATPVVADEVLDGIITEVKLATDAVTAAKIAAGAVTETKVADNAISTPKLIAGAVETEKIAAGAVQADKIAAAAVTAEKIEALAVTADKIAANAVTAGHILAGAVTAEKLETNLVVAGTPGGNRVQINEANGIEQWLDGERTLWIPPTGMATFTGAVTTGTDTQFISIEPADVSTSFPRIIMQDDVSTRRIAMYYQTNTLFFRRETISTTPSIRGGNLVIGGITTGLYHHEDVSGNGLGRLVLYDTGRVKLSGVSSTGTELGAFDVQATGNCWITANDQLVVVSTNNTRIQSDAGDIYLETGQGSALRLFAEGNAQLISDGTVKAFVIDHPLDPDRYLVHGCTESPDAGVEYWGVAEIVGYEATVTLPAYFEALTRDDSRQVQLTVVEPETGFPRPKPQPPTTPGHTPTPQELKPGPPVIPRAAASIPRDGKFTITCDGPDGTRVSWLVKAARRDAGNFPVEPLKSETTVAGDGPYRYIVQEV